MKIKKIHFVGGIHWLYWIIILSSILLTVVAWNIASTKEHENLKIQFDFQSEQLLDLVSERMSHYEDALRAGVAAIYSHTPPLNIDDWKNFSESLQVHNSYPGINGIGVIFFIPPNKKDPFLLDQRTLRPEFKLHPSHNKNEYWPITFIEPVEHNFQAVGLDMAFESNRFNAAKKARDLNTTQITAPIILVQDKKKTPGFLQYVPFYETPFVDDIESRKAQFKGHVYAPFIMHKLIAGALDQKNRQLTFSVYDNDDMLYDELNSNNVHFDKSPIFKKEITIDMYGRPWHFTIHTSLSFRKSINTQQSLFLLASGIIINCLLVFLFSSLSNSIKTSLRFAHKMTKKLDVSEEYFRHIIEAAPCGIIIINNDGNIETVNPYALALLGYEKNELTGQSIEILVPANVRGTHNTYRQHFAEAPEKRTMGIGRDVHCLSKSGRLFPAEIGLAQFKGENGLKVLTTIIDMTVHVETTNELKRSNKELNDFAYVASHDLKAPLRGIMQLSQWIQEDTDAFSSDETKQNISLLKNRTSRLEKLLDDLLTYSRIERQQGEIKTVDCNEMLSSLYDLQDAPKYISLTLDNTLPKFETLRTPLEIIFRNLIGNALKHHDKPSGSIHITAKELPHVYEFSVSDNGPGIDPKHHERIFELFKTLKPRDEVEGSGMGLSIIKKILDYYKCTIDVYSDGHNGTCFTFTWPISITITGRTKI